MRKLHVLLLLACVSWSLYGCDSGPRVVPAEGTVTMKGAALAGANVTVVYPDGNSATGVSDPAGKFMLTYAGRNGALPGADLKVSVVKITSGFKSVEATGGKSSGPPTPEQITEMLKQSQKMGAEKTSTKQTEGPKNEVDVKYKSPETSGLKLTIPEGGSKDLKVEIP